MKISRIALGFLLFSLSATLISTMALGAVVAEPRTSQPLSTEEIYALAQEQGYEGALEDFAALLENRVPASEGVKSLTVNDRGELIAELTSGETVNLGRVRGADGVGIADAYVDETGHLILVLTNGETVDCGLVAGMGGSDGVNGKDGVDGKDGLTPHIGENGNWWIGDYDTNVPAQGAQGEQGKQGEKGDPGEPGKDGDDGEDGKDGITPHIGEDGDWWIGDYDTNVPAQGEQGKQGEKGEQGEPGQDGKDGVDGKDGKNGEDGVTPHIGENGNWWIGDHDTNVPAQGARGEQGKQGEKGEQGEPGKDGQDGTNGQDGQDGKDGKNGEDGVGIERAYVDEHGHLILVLTNGETVDCGLVAGMGGSDGVNGEDGVDGKDGVDGADGKDGVDGKDGLTPHIGKNGNWWIGDFDTNVPAQGEQGKQGEKGEQGEPGKDGADGQDGADGKDGVTPHIGEDGDWWIGDYDTNVPAQGAQGEQGKQGEKGDPGDPGQDGEDGEDGKDGVTPHIGENGNWWIGDYDTNVPAQGEPGKDGVDGQDGKNGTDGKDGITPHIGEDGDWWIGDYDTNVPAQGEPGKDGTDGQDGKNGTDGKNGLTPHIGEDGDWWIGDYDTNVPAQGAQGEKGDTGEPGKDGEDGKDGTNGEDGVGIADAYVDENGHLILVLTNGETVDCGLVAGMAGSDGVDGQNGENGLTPHIGEDGDWWIGDHDTNVPAQGAQGEQGEPGKDGQDGTNGQDGKDGKNGEDGVGIERAYVDENGHLILVLSNGETVDCGLVAGMDGSDGVNGKDGKDGVDGADGKNGVTPHIGEDGDWWIGDYDTNVPAQGAQGEQGKQGDKGDKGDPGEPGHVHNMGNWEVWIEATCAQYGYETRKCLSDNCDYQEHRPLAPKEHIYEDVSVIVASTCTTAGKIMQRCSMCGEARIADMALANHAYKDGKCTVCGAVDYRAQFKLEEQDGGYVVAGPGEFLDSTLVIPKEIDGIPVIEIKKGAFKDCSYESVEIHAKVIRRGAFQDCKSLRTVLLGDGVEHVEESAFHGCTDLTVTVGPSVREISAHAFEITGVEITFEYGTWAYFNEEEKQLGTLPTDNRTLQPGSSFAQYTWKRTDLEDL